MARNPVYSINGVETVNPNVKAYQTKPEISTKDWTNAFKWNSNNHLMIQMFSSQNIFCTSDEVSKLSKEKYRKFAKDITDCKWSSFEKMMQDINQIRMIKLNKEEWENSECTCSFWQKNYKCNHVISRLKLASFSTVAYSTSLQHKRKKDPLKKWHRLWWFSPMISKKKKAFKCATAMKKCRWHNMPKTSFKLRQKKSTPSNAKKSKLNWVFFLLQNISWIYVFFQILSYRKLFLYFYNYYFLFFTLIYKNSQIYVIFFYNIVPPSKYGKIKL